MSTFTGQIHETGELMCTIINWRTCTDLWTKGMMPKYKSIKDSLGWAIGESLACLGRKKFRYTEVSLLYSDPSN